MCHRIFRLAETGVLVTSNRLRSVHTYRKLNIVTIRDNISWQIKKLYLRRHPDVSNKKTEVMDHRKAVKKNVIRRNCFETMKYGTVECWFKTNRITFTTMMKICVGCLTTAHRKFIRQNVSKDCI
jgi:hypothetical protein